MRVVWSKRALARMEAIEVYISRDDPVRALSWVAELFDRGDVIGEYPDSGHAPPEMPASNVLQAVHGTYRIIYRVFPEKDEVLILSVFEGHRQLRPGDIEPE